MLLKLRILFVIALTLSFFELKSQSLELITSDKKVFEKPDAGYVNAYATIKNISNTKLTLKAKCQPLNLASGHTVAFCFVEGGICFPPSTGQTISTNTLDLVAGATSKKADFNGQLYFDNEGTSSARYTFFNVLNENDKVTFDVTFVISVLGGVGEEAIEKTLISIVNSQNNLTLNVPEYLISKTFSLFDSNGNFISSNIISNNQTNILISNYSNGIYFIKFDGIEKSIKFSIAR
ncbi:MAG: T9SS type A sorting domain-containing protein [Candidatus Kapabacteria bacterium]|nr:T9SS type A sorting domain-containing protein [Candidatus Kapabacteria bacterium]